MKWTTYVCTRCRTKSHHGFAEDYLPLQRWQLHCPSKQCKGRRTVHALQSVEGLRARDWVVGKTVR